ncbi:ribonuclease M5 [Bacilliculturomica massiliensis]|uniref:ribonuclease M5 n=1 Tax=Bacilliculturomica massiliensis TaxID=1917867 RepID=UPI00103192E5|nr:ribonuclease M5 [Bacilliculturomica massiliensis]
MIKEVIVVEGRDDESAVRRAVDAATIATHGYGIRKSTIELIRKAYEEKGIIVFTDPDFAGEQIRKRISGICPEAKHAYLTRREAEKDGDIGIENASPEDIRAALEKARCTAEEARREFTADDMQEYGLTGHPCASERRAAMGAALGIGYANGKTFLARLNHYGITREEFETAWTSCIHRLRSDR